MRNHYRAAMMDAYFVGVLLLLSPLGASILLSPFGEPCRRVCDISAGSGCVSAGLMRALGDLDRDGGAFD